MDENPILMKWVLPVIIAVAGLGGGYYFGYGRGVAAEKSAAESRRIEAEKEATKAVNPFEQASVNPFEKSPTNPFENVKVNPFK